jgi:uncharacterized membrane protein HdeD (DUF308 family)
MEDSPMISQYQQLTGMDQVRTKWGWYLVLGIALVILGFLALAAVGLTTMATVLMFGWFILIGGVFEVVGAFWAPKWSGFFLHLLCGVLSVVVGGLILGHPVAAAAGLTLVLAILFLTNGAIRIASALMLRYPSWGWSVLDGVISLILGGMIVSDYPSASVWVIGTFVGIALLFRGWSWVMFAFAVRNFKQTVDEIRREEMTNRIATHV